MRLPQRDDGVAKVAATMHDGEDQHAVIFLAVCKKALKSPLTCQA